VIIIIQKVLSYLREHQGEEYYTTNNFAMLDGKGNILLPHLDQIQNEMSAATCYAPGKRLSCM